MLAQAYSLKGERRINSILKKGFKKQSDNFGAFYIIKETDDFPKFAFIVSKKISKLAVHRNRVKRAISESVRRNVKLIPKGSEVVFLVKKSIDTRSTDEIMKEVQDFLTNMDFKV